MALLFRNITSQHPFLDGNKRTGLMLIESLLEDNKLTLKLTDKQKESLVLDIAQGRYDNLEKFSKFLIKNTK